MNEQIERTALEDVLDAYVAAATDSGAPPLAEWVRRFPQFERELTEFAASWSLMKGLPPAPDAEEVDEETLVLRGMSVVQNLLHAQEQAVAAPAPAVVPTAAVSIASLLAAAQSRDLTPRQLAAAVGIGSALLRKLDLRRIDIVQMPRDAIDALATALATALGRAADEVAAYLRQGPALAAMARRAEQAPEVGPPEDFFDAIRNDTTMTDEQKQRWLAFESRELREPLGER
jgi:hypothetical protein